MSESRNIKSASKSALTAAAIALAATGTAVAKGPGPHCYTPPTAYRVAGELRCERDFYDAKTCDPGDERIRVEILAEEDKTVVIVARGDLGTFYAYRIAGDQPAWIAATDWAFSPANADGSCNR